MRKGVCNHVNSPHRRKKASRPWVEREKKNAVRQIDYGGISRNHCAFGRKGKDQPERSEEKAGRRSSLRRAILNRSTGGRRHLRKEEKAVRPTKKRGESKKTFRTRKNLPRPGRKKLYWPKKEKKEEFNLCQLGDAEEDRKGDLIREKGFIFSLH